MSKVSMNLQDSFLNAARRQNASVTIILTDGSQLKGKVNGFDNFTVILDVGKIQHLIYKHAIATVFPDKPLDRRPLNAQGQSAKPDEITPEKIQEFKKAMEGQK
ncbi:MAG: RNA chaperone Hfq [bacterium]|nr:RNA chaperone Hfq [bacterium]